METTTTRQPRLTSIHQEGIANTIWEQMGGHKTSVMIGVKQLAFGMDKNENVYLTVKFMKAKDKINFLKITLNASDTYDMEFGYIRGVNYKVIKEIEGVYHDMLIKIFETTTELCTRL